MARILDYDPVSRTKRVFHYDHAEDSFVIETLQDVNAIVEQSQDSYNAFAHKSNHKFKGDGFHHMGQIPLNTLFDIMRMCNYEEEATEKAVRLWMDDPANLKFRSRPGRLSR